ncbi:MAG: glycosyltransferase family 39 protein [Rhodospirillum sp.]|nr:glycosyltransferase family 39 protein [Rhodospirillum sp.]MCF8489988.1 glycosyltransferase family 39 protein [Rhodospirillum sp.]MCF8501518.1 glycosyltransferase family 39 protein [Rhodospirillum sp.]
MAFVLLVTAARLVFLELDLVSIQPGEAALWLAGRTAGPYALGAEPLVPLLLGVVTAIFGDTEFALRAPGVLAEAMATMVVWRLAIILYEPRVAFWSVVLFATLPVVSHGAAVAATGAYMALFWAVALYALLRGLKTDRLFWWLTLGVVFGLGLLTGWTMVLLVPCFIIYALVSTEYYALWRRQGLWVALCLGLILAAPGYWFAIGPEGGATMPLPTPALGGVYLVSQLALFGPLPLAVLLWVAFHSGGAGGAGQNHDGRRAADDRHRMGYRTRFFLCFSLPVLVFQTFAAASGLDAQPVAAVSAYAGGTILVAAWMTATPFRHLLLRFAVLLNVLGALAYFNMDSGLRATGLRPPEWLDPFSDSRGLDSVGRWGAKLAALYPGAQLAFDDADMRAILSFYIHPHPEGTLLVPGGAKALANYPGVMPGDYLVITRDSDQDWVMELPPGSRTAGFIALEVLSGRWLTVNALHLSISGQGTTEKP